MLANTSDPHHITVIGPYLYVLEGNTHPSIYLDVVTANQPT